MCKFLIVEDSKPTAMIIRKYIERAGHEVVEASSVEGAIALISANGIDCMVLDIQLDDGVGIEVLEHMRDNGVYIPTVTMSASSVDIPDYAKNCGHLFFTAKPFRIGEFVEKIKKVAKTWNDIRSIQECQASISAHMDNFETGMQAFVEG